MGGDLSFGLWGGVPDFGLDAAFIEAVVLEETALAVAVVAFSGVGKDLDKSVWLARPRAFVPSLRPA